MLQDFRNIVFLLVAIALMLGMVLYASGEFDIFFKQNPFTAKQVIHKEPKPTAAPEEAK